jgi:hypothetical protein
MRDRNSEPSTAERTRRDEDDAGPVLLCVPTDPQRSVREPVARPRSRDILGEHTLDWVATTADGEGWP